jgi:transglutaminase-like putative cysteine protease
MTPPEPTPVSPLSRDARARAAAYLGLLAAYLAAAAGDPLTPLQLGVFGAAALWSLGFERRLPRLFFAPPLKIGLILAGSTLFAVFLGARAGRGDPQDFSHAIARFLLWNAAVFILSRNKSEYDFWTLAIIELSLFMISGAFVQPPAFLPLLLASLACTLYAFQRAALLRAGDAPGAGGAGPALVTAALTVEIGAVLFVAFPRPAAGGGAAEGGPLPPAPGPPMPTAGRIGPPRRSDLLDLVHFERLKADPSPVLRVRVRDLEDRTVPPEQTLYLRGAVLDRYEGGRWKAPGARREPRRDADDGRPDGWTSLEPHPPPGRILVRQRIVLAPGHGDLAFALPDPVRTSLPEARFDPAGVLFFPAAPQERVEYEVESALMPLDVPPAGRIPEPAPQHLRVPPELASLLRETARRAAEGAGPGLHARVTRLVHFLMRNGFAYRLDPFVPSGGRDPVEHFLEARAGSCVHFASALALLCRSLGIGARVATGFQLHDPDPDGSFLVRNSDAHAWVEVWFGPAAGWRAYDATPPEGRASPPPGEPVATTAGSAAGPEPEERGRWDRFVVDFDARSRSRLLDGARAALARAGSGLVAILTHPATAAALGAVAAAAILAYALLPRSGRRRIRQALSGFRDPCPVDFYRDFLWALARRGRRKPPAATPREFAASLKGFLPDADLDFLTVKFYEARFGGRPPGPEERRRLEAIVRALLREPSKA